MFIMYIQKEKFLNPSKKILPVQKRRFSRICGLCLYKRQAGWVLVKSLMLQMPHALINWSTGSKTKYKNSLGQPVFGSIVHIIIYLHCGI